MRNKILFLSGFVILAFVIFLIVRGVGSDDSLDVNVSNIDVAFEIERFDKELSQVFVGNLKENIEKLNSNYSDFFSSFNENIIGVSDGIDNSVYEIYLKTFLNDYSVIEATKEVDNVFDDLNSLEKEIGDGFKHLLYYYPDFEIPRIVSFIAGFNQSIIIMDKFIGIGLDKYLGSDCVVYEMLGIPEFSKFEMTSSQIPIDIMIALYESEFPFLSKSENLLENMIYNGMKLYFLRAMFPKFDNARINKYTSENIKYCETYEKDMWTYLIENKLLFETGKLTIRKFTYPAPFTNQFGPDSPPRVANWLGLRIVESYVKNNNVSLQDLLKNTDYQYILNASGYNPK